MWVKNEVQSAPELRVAGGARRAVLIGWTAARASGTPRGPATITQPQLYPDAPGGRTCVLVDCVSRGTSRLSQGREGPQESGEPGFCFLVHRPNKIPSSSSSTRSVPELTGARVP